MQAVKSDGEIRIYDGYLFRESIKEIPHRKYDEADKSWVVPISKENIVLLNMLGATLDDELTELLCAETGALHNDEQPILPMRIKATPYKHQIRAYNFALKIFGMGGDANDI